MTLKEARQQSGMTQRTLAAELAKIGCNTDTGMLSRYEGGVCYPTKETISALECVLQVDHLFFPGLDVLADDIQNEPTQGEISPLAERVLACMPTGKENAKTRVRLACDTGLPDRAVRLGIEELRKAGYLIINDQSGAGYFMTDDLDELAKQYKQDTARAMAILVRRKAIRKKLKECGRPV